MTENGIYIFEIFYLLISRETETETVRERERERERERNFGSLSHLLMLSLVNFCV